MEKKVPRSRQKERGEKKVSRGRQKGKIFRAGFPPPVPSYFPAKYASVSATFRSISCRSASKDGNFTSPRSRL